MMVFYRIPMEVWVVAPCPFGPPRGWMLLKAHGAKDGEASRCWELAGV